MNTYQYSAMDDHGKTCSGQLKAKNERNAGIDLKEQGLFPISLNQIDNPDETSDETGNKKKFRTKFCILGFEISIRKL